MTSVNSSPEKVLVVDDDPIIRDMMIDILDYEGYPVEVARNGREALELLQGNESYLVFLDLMMPIMDGRELCERLNAYPSLRQRHIIILMSAMDRLEEAASLHVDAIMPKPFVLEDILKAMQPYMA